MTNKEFLEKVALKTGLSTDSAERMSSSLIDAVLDEVAVGNSVDVQGFGSFEPLEKASRKIFNPASKTYVVVPKGATIGYQMSASLKTQFNKE